MTWKTPRIVEVPVGMEINMYACAAAGSHRTALKRWAEFVRSLR
jgi:coenzyme PQQ precursor peptide PqqA